MGGRVVVIADDATGASATAALLASRGSVAQACFQAPAAWPSGVDAVVLSIDSRHLRPTDARGRAAAAAEWALAHRAGDVAKRIDSTLRGNLGAEIEGVLGVFGETAAALVVPAFPRSERVAIGGHVLWRGQPLARTEARTDPHDRVAVSHVPTLLRGQTTLPVAHVPLSVVEERPAALTRALRAALASGARIIVADAVAEANLTRLRAAARGTRTTWVPVDPGPFTAAYVTSAVSPRGRAAPRAPASGAPGGGCVLGVVGSRTPVTERQVAACARRGAVILRVESNGTCDLDAAVAAAGSGTTVILRSDPRPVSLSPAAYAARLAIAARTVLERSGGRVAGLYVSGGDTLRAVCRALGADAVRVAAEVEPLIALGVLVGGPWDGLRLISKGGFVGDTDAAARSVRQLRTSSRPSGHDGT